MTNRPDIEELLCDYLEGTLDPSRRAEVEQILAADPELRKGVQQMMQARDVLRSLPAEKLPPERADEIRHAITDAPAARRWVIQFSSGRLAAALLLAATAALVIWSALPRESANPIAANIPLRGDGATAKASSGKARLEADQRSMADALAHAPIDSNDTVVMFVRSPDIPAVEREIRSLFGPQMTREIASNAAPPDITTLTPPAPVAAPTAGSAQPAPSARQRPANDEALRAARINTDLRAKELAREQAESAAQPAQIRLNNVTPEQMALLQRNVVALRPSNQVEVIPPGTDADRQQQFALQQRQFTSQQLPLQQYPQWRPQLFQQSVPAADARYDLTIILEPQPLPPAAQAATLPSTAPQQRPQTP